ncbi:MAG: hypothetical protein AAFV98_05920, partial [Chloroflexota bacterium]
WNLSTETYNTYLYEYALVENCHITAYDATHNTLVAIAGDYNIVFNPYGSETIYHDILDLSPILDSPIVSIEWEQPIFYDEDTN